MIPTQHDPIHGPRPSLSAYTHGCRCEDCKAAGREYRQNRKAVKAREAKQRGPFAQTPDDTEVDSWEDSRAKADRNCPKCGLMMFWDARRTMHVCDCGNFLIPESAAERAREFIERGKRAPVITGPVDMSSDRGFMLRQITLAQQCQKARNEFDVSEIESQTRQAFWMRDQAQHTQNVFTVIERLIGRATTEPELSRLESDFQLTYNGQQASNIRAGMQNVLATLANRVQRLPESRDFIVRHIGTDGRLTGIKPQLTFDPIPGREPISPNIAKAITGPKATARIVDSRYGPDDDSGSDEDYEDSNYEDEDYERIDNIDLSPAGSKLVTYAIIGAGLVIAAIWLYGQAEEYKERRADAKAHRCAYSRLYRQCERAEQLFAATYDGIHAYSETVACPAHYDRAKKDIAAHMQSTGAAPNWMLGNRAI